MSIQTEVACNQTAKRIDAQGRVLIPLYRLEHRSFWRDSPKGRAKDAARFPLGQKATLENPRQKRETLDKSTG
jgi:hypothetical protein